MKVHLCCTPPVTTCLPSLYHVPSIFLSLWASIQGSNILCSCWYIGFVGSISSCVITCCNNAILSAFIPLAKTLLGSKTTLELSCSPLSYSGLLDSASALPFVLPGM